MICIKGVLKIFFKFHRKTLVLESLCNKFVGLQAQLYWKETPTQVFSVKFPRFLLNIYLLWRTSAASENLNLENLFGRTFCQKFECWNQYSFTKNYQKLRNELWQSIQEWTKWNLWKTAFKKFYLVYSWILCPS